MIKIINKTTRPEVSIDIFLNEEQKKQLCIYSETNNLEFTIVRGAFHNSCTQLKVVFLNDTPLGFRIQALKMIAKNIGWHYYLIDGTHAIVKNEQKNPTNTWHRWKKNNPSSHLREASKKKWHEYHQFIGDLEEKGEWNDDLYVPSKWEK
jgi:hypothetical protein